MTDGVNKRELISSLRREVPHPAASGGKVDKSKLITGPVKVIAYLSVLGSIARWAPPAAYQGRLIQMSRLERSGVGPTRIRGEQADDFGPAGNRVLEFVHLPARCSRMRTSRRRELINSSFVNTISHLSIASCVIRSPPTALQAGRSSPPTPRSMPGLRTLSRSHCDT